MGRFRESDLDSDADTAIDISPLIDCVFILLIFFIVTTVFVEESGIEVDKPQAAAASQEESKSIVITVNAKGQVSHEGTDIGVTGVQPLVKRMRGAGEESPVIIQTDAEAPSGRVVRVIDEAKLAGAEKISLATRKG